MKMEAALELLVSMGFAADSATQALAAAGGDIHKATDWLLNHDHSHPPQTPPPPPSDSTPPNIQPKINRFFNLNPKKDIKPFKSLQESEEIEENEQSLSLIHRKKRQRSPEIQETLTKPSPGAPSPPHAPLSERMRPRVLDEVVGQDHLLAGDSLLRSAAACGRLPSIILWGPPGTGKTSIARAIVNSCASASSYRFVSLRFFLPDLGYSKEYIYPPDNPDSSSSQTYLPPSLQGYKFLHWP